MVYKGKEQTCTCREIPHFGLAFFYQIHTSQYVQMYTAQKCQIRGHDRYLYVIISFMFVHIHIDAVTSGLKLNLLTGPE